MTRSRAEPTSWRARATMSAPATSPPLGRGDRGTRRAASDPRGRPPRQALPDQGRDHLRPARSAACGRSTTSRSRSTRGETLGLVGESGCGKSTLSRTILQLIPPTSGSVRFEGQEITGLSTPRPAPLRREDADDLPGPLRVAEPAQAGRRRSSATRCGCTGSPRATTCSAAVQELLETVGLNPEHYNRYPHEFSGGQRQRIGIARALSLKPTLIIADEPVSALDVSIQAQIINLLEDLQGEFDLTYVFVAHDLGVVRHVADRIAVMYLGQDRRDRPRRRGLRAADPPVHGLAALGGADPGPARERRARSRSCSRATCRARRTRPSACRFHTRCPRATEICSEVEPPLIDYGGGHWAACHHPVDRPEPAAVAA